MTDDPQKFLKVALGVVKKAEPVFRKSFGKASGILAKNDTYRSPVTDIDKEIEKIITEELIKQFPEHSISGEELPVQKRAGPYTWYIDPIDGTINYIRGLPTCSISVGLWRGDAPVVGIVFDPVLATVYSAIQGSGAFRNTTEKLTVSDISQLGDAVGMVSRAKTGVDDKALERVATKMHRTREFGGSALELCYIAEGKLELYISERIKTYDVAASALVLIEAGGRVTDWEGNPFTPASRTIVASNGKIHEEVLLALKG